MNYTNHINLKDNTHNSSFTICNIHNSTEYEPATTGEHRIQDMGRKNLDNVMNKKCCLDAIHKQQ